MPGKLLALNSLANLHLYGMNIAAGNPAFIFNYNKQVCDADKNIVGYKPAIYFIVIQRVQRAFIGTV
jgi:hypothetical protein